MYRFRIQFCIAWMWHVIMKNVIAQQKTWMSIADVIGYQGWFLVLVT